MASFFFPSSAILSTPPFSLVRDIFRRARFLNHVSSALTLSGTSKKFVFIFLLCQPISLSSSVFTLPFSELAIPMLCGFSVVHSWPITAYVKERAMWLPEMFVFLPPFPRQNWSSRCQRIHPYLCLSCFGIGGDGVWSPILLVLLTEPCSFLDDETAMRIRLWFRS